MTNKETAKACIMDCVATIESVNNNEPSGFDQFFANPETEESKKQTIAQNCKAIKEYLKML